MRFFIGTAHFFAPDYRDAGMHRFAKTLAAKGHCVDFVTFGQSWLKQQMKAEARSYVESAELAARKGVNPKGIHVHVHQEIIHPVSGSPFVELLTIPFERRYGHHLDKWAQESVRLADVVVLECGYAPYYFNELKNLNPRAKFIELGGL
jgi:2-beta-glucuronyltransferase